MHFGLVDWEKHLLDLFLGVTERAFMLHCLYLKGIQFAIDGLGHAAKISSLLVALQPVPDFGIEGVPESFTKGHMIFLSFPICQASQAELVLQIVQGHLIEVQINLGLFLPALPQVCADSEPLVSAHVCSRLSAKR